jgi:hypothetical protein
LISKLNAIAADQKDYQNLRPKSLEETKDMTNDPFLEQATMLNKDDPQNNLRGSLIEKTIISYQYLIDCKLVSNLGKYHPPSGIFMDLGLN